MHRHGVLLGLLGFDALLCDLTTRWVRPIAAQVLPQFNGATLNSHRRLRQPAHQGPTGEGAR
jgi:hypothetical protein